MNRRLLPALARDRRGVAVIEFALLAPVLLLGILGSLEIGHTYYVDVMLEGQLQKAARDMTLEGASSAEQQAAIQQVVRDYVHELKTDATVTFDIRSFRNYRGAEQGGEEFTDTEGASPFNNNICDNGEAFADMNGNGVRDQTLDRGGAKDVVMITANVVYPRLALGRLFGMGNDVRLEAKTLLRNQPSSNQRTAVEGHCGTAH